MSAYIKSFFENDLVNDDREPLLTLSFPGVDETFGIFPPNYEFWQQFFVLQFLLGVIGALFGYVIHSFVVTQRGTTTALVVSWGMVVPAVAQLPYWIMNWLGIKNMVLKLMIAGCAVTLTQRAHEATYASTPSAEVVEHDAGKYMSYCWSFMHYNWDTRMKRRVPVRVGEFVTTFGKVVSSFFLLSIFLSVEEYYEFQPFQSPVQISEFHLNFDLLQVSHLLNCLFLAYTGFLFCSLCFDSATLLEQVMGNSIKPCNISPFLESRSATEFWGRRWNRWLYMVVRTGTFHSSMNAGLSRPVAMVLTVYVITSLHEFAMAVITYPITDPPKSASDHFFANECGSPGCFKFLAFYLWTISVLALEGTVQPHFRFANSPPAVVASFAIMLLILPVSHWYVGDLALSGLFSSISVGIWHIRKVTTA